MTDNRLTLFCLIDGEAMFNAFSVKISSGDTVDDLKDLIKAKKTNDFSDLDADKLTLWRVSIPDDDDDDDEDDDDDDEDDDDDDEDDDDDDEDDDDDDEDDDDDDEDDEDDDEDDEDDDEDSRIHLRNIPKKGKTNSRRRLTSLMCLNQCRLNST
ncbi:hypothetical protein MVEG_10739 [Podila verticillata NRRL 6337]|nr:hypothetical protein MVEG_10739 [Podila verticillata NRRL 6337]